MTSPVIKRFLIALVGASIALYIVSQYTYKIERWIGWSSSFSWADIPFKNPPPPLVTPPWQSPEGPPHIPKIQAEFPPETESDRAERLARREAVLDAFRHSWKNYRENAWLHDELKPLSGGSKDPYGGWGATLVDSLDTLWLMDLTDYFDEAVMGLYDIDFSTCSLTDLNTFETVIRFLGGLLSAWDLCCTNDGTHSIREMAARHAKYGIILDTAIEVGEMMYRTFDTPNNIPISRWKWQMARAGRHQEQGTSMVMAELGTLSMEFTRLSQLTQDPKYYSAIAYITDIIEEGQNATRLPGLWPLSFNPQGDEIDFATENQFTMGGMVDSIYEYLPKMHLLLHGREPVYERMYHIAAEAAKRYLLFEPYVPPSQNLSPLVVGQVDVYGPRPFEEDDNNRRTFDFQGEAQHLTCFAGGMFALAAKMFPHAKSSPEDMRVGARITDGCIWSYLAMKNGVGPEHWKATPCRKGRAAATNGKEADFEGSRGDCEWVGSTDERSDGLPAGMTALLDSHYYLRPEAIESVFILHRTTGDPKWADMAWKMFDAIQQHCRAKYGYAALASISHHKDLLDSAESFWTAETLKYFFLIFSEPELMSLDDYVLNTEAHPFRYRSTTMEPWGHEDGVV